MVIYDIIKSEKTEKRYGRDIACPGKALLLDIVPQVKGLTQINPYYTYGMTSSLPPQ